jgi:hypothetical protein
VEWTFPLEFVELVWGDGKATRRQTISATGMAPFGNHQFRIPFGEAGMKWDDLRLGTRLATGPSRSQFD